MLQGAAQVLHREGAEFIQQIEPRSNADCAAGSGVNLGPCTTQASPATVFPVHMGWLPDAVTSPDSLPLSGLLGFLNY
jgi:hypothetical protein